MIAVKRTDKIQDEEMERRDGETKRGVEHIEDEEESSMAWDDLTGEDLLPTEVRNARPQEIKYINDENVLGGDA